MAAQEVTSTSISNGRYLRTIVSFFSRTSAAANYSIGWGLHQQCWTPRRTFGHRAIPACYLIGEVAKMASADSIGSDARRGPSESLQSWEPALKMCIGTSALALECQEVRGRINLLSRYWVNNHAQQSQEQKEIVRKPGLASNGHPYFRRRPMKLKLPCP